MGGTKAFRRAQPNAYTAKTRQVQDEEMDLSVLDEVVSLGNFGAVFSLLISFPDGVDSVLLSD